MFSSSARPLSLSLWLHWQPAAEGTSCVAALEVEMPPKVNDRLPRHHDSHENGFLPKTKSPFFFPFFLFFLFLNFFRSSLRLTFGIEKSCHAVFAFDNIEGGFEPVADAATLQRTPIHQIGPEIRKTKKEKTQMFG